MRLLTILVLLAATVHADQPLLRTVDDIELIVFRSTQPVQQGKVTIGRNITITYRLKIGQGKRARYIALDKTQAGNVATQIMADTPAHPDWAGGFLVRDTTQNRLDVHIASRLLAKVGNVRAQDRMRQLENTLSNEANMAVTLKHESGKPVQIRNIYID